ncbi:hypothetical protein BpHYR1_017524 [Brachionus plicatilis]|uniref:Uncharacterized protein n=1 Tax=Brachionus plicatilis TaxID=10195 RepID=A0A3M7QDF9_BRAPC|nr:hypothetical protein BpHYR1_017524 [Brachionus plicatilis]
MNLNRNNYIQQKNKPVRVDGLKKEQISMEIGKDRPERKNGIRRIRISYPKEGENILRSLSCKTIMYGKNVWFQSMDKNKNVAFVMKKVNILSNKIKFKLKPNHEFEQIDSEEIRKPKKKDFDGQIEQLLDMS